MAPLLVLVVVTLVARAIGWFGVAWLDAWHVATAIGLAAMLLLTASAHFTRPRRDGLVAIVPPWMPHPALVVTATGVLELLGAVGLLVPVTRVAAAICVALLLAAMFPANVRAARGVEHPAAPSTPLPLRTAIQVVFVGACVVVVVGSLA